MVKSPLGRVLLRRGRRRGRRRAPLATFATALRDELPGDLVTIETRAARRVSSHGSRPPSSLLVRYGDEAVADAFCSSRLSGDWGRAFGTLPAGLDYARIIDRHRAVA